MILYHGTNDASPILNGKMKKGTWLALHRFHAFRIAERRSRQRGGDPVVVEIDTDNITRVAGRDNPTYLFNGGGYKLCAKHIMERYDM